MAAQSAIRTGKRIRLPELLEGGNSGCMTQTTADNSQTKPEVLQADGNCRYHYAKHDPATCMARGLFQPIFGRRPKGVDHVANYSGMTMTYRCHWQLGPDDLRTLQGLLALASPVDKPNMLTAESNLTHHRQLRLALNLKGTAKDDLSLVVEGSYYLLAREIGLLSDGGKTYRLLRESIDRLSAVNVLVEKNGKSCASNLLAYASEEKTRNLVVALNPRLTAAVLGARMDANGSHTRIDLTEVRAIQGSITRILHQYLSALINPGESRTLQAATMMGQIWPGPATQRAQQKQRNRLHDAIEELRGLEWQYQRVAGNRAVIAKGHYLKYIITRPKIRVPVPVDPEAPAPWHPPRRKSKEPNLTFITPEEEAAYLLKRTIKAKPRTALRKHLREMTIEQFHEAASRQPVTAMLHCLDKLSDEQIAVFLAKDTEATLRYAATRLTPQQIAKAAKTEPLAVIRHAFPKLDQEQQSRIVAQYPEQLMRHHQAFPAGVLENAAIHAPFDALRFAAENLSPKTLQECMDRNPVGAIRYCYDRMTPAMRRKYLDIAPWAMLALHHDTILQEDQDVYIQHLTEMTYREFQTRKSECPEIMLFTTIKLPLSDIKWCRRRIKELTD